MIRVTYTYPTASGARAEKYVVLGTAEAAETICKAVEALADRGYKLEDVTNEIEGVNV